MGNQLGKLGPGRDRVIGLRAATLAAPLLLGLAACGDGGGSVADAPAPTEPVGQETGDRLLPCSEDRHLVAFDIVDFLTTGNLEILGPWANQGTAPTSRAGSVEVVRTYRQKGYEILYVTTIPPDMFGERSVADAVTEWLQSSGYPVDGGTSIWAWDGEQSTEGQTWISITDELLRFASEGVSVDASYTENEDKTFAFATGGVPQERNFTLTPVEGLGEAAPTSAPTTLIPNDDLVAHLATVQQLPQVCQPG